MSSRGLLTAAELPRAARRTPSVCRSNANARIIRKTRAEKTLQSNPNDRSVKSGCSALISRGREVQEVRPPKSPPAHTVHTVGAIAARRGVLSDRI